MAHGAQIFSDLDIPTGYVQAVQKMLGYKTRDFIRNEAYFFVRRSKE